MTRYADLSYLEGTEIVIKRLHMDKMGRPIQDIFYVPPTRILFVKDYPKTVLIRKEYAGGSYMRMVTKAAMFCGDVELIDCNGLLLVGQNVRN